MLAVIPAVVFHTAVVLVVPAFANQAPRWLNVALLPLDVAIVRRLLQTAARALRRRAARAHLRGPALSAHGLGGRAGAERRATAAAARPRPRPRRGSRRRSRGACRRAISRSPSTRAGCSGGRSAISLAMRLRSCSAKCGVEAPISWRTSSTLTSWVLALRSGGGDPRLGSSSPLCDRLLGLTARHYSTCETDGSSDVWPAGGSRARNRVRPG